MRKTALLFAAVIVSLPAPCFAQEEVEVPPPAMGSTQSAEPTRGVGEAGTLPEKGTPSDQNPRTLAPPSPGTDQLSPPSPSELEFQREQEKVVARKKYRGKPGGLSLLRKELRAIDEKYATQLWVVKHQVAGLDTRVTNIEVATAELPGIKQQLRDLGAETRKIRARVDLLETAGAPASSPEGQANNGLIQQEEGKTPVASTPADSPDSAWWAFLDWLVRNWLWVIGACALLTIGGWLWHRFKKQPRVEIVE